MLAQYSYSLHHHVALSFATAFGLVTQSAKAQIVVQKPIHLSHAYGYVFTETGKPLVGVEIELIGNDSASFETKTDATGQFNFPRANGKYLLRARVPGSAIAARDVIVASDLAGAFHRGPIYVMIKPGGACEDCTSPIFPNKKAFDRAARENTVNHD